MHTMLAASRVYSIQFYGLLCAQLSDRTGRCPIVGDRNVVSVLADTVPRSATYTPWSRRAEPSLAIGTRRTVGACVAAVAAPIASRASRATR